MLGVRVEGADVRMEAQMRSMARNVTPDTAEAEIDELSVSLR